MADMALQSSLECFLFETSMSQLNSGLNIKANPINFELDCKGQSLSDTECTYPFDPTLSNV